MSGLNKLYNENKRDTLKAPITTVVDWGGGGGGAGGGGRGGAARVTSYIWHSTDVRAE